MKPNVVKEIFIGLGLGVAGGLIWKGNQKREQDKVRRFYEDYNKQKSAQ